MTDKTYRKKVKNFGGVIDKTLDISWPETVQVNSRQEAIDIIDILQWEKIDDGPEYSPEMNTLLDALRAAIEKGIA
jgi:hypothetical protein